MTLNRIELLEKFMEEDPADPFNYYALAIEWQHVNLKKASLLFTKLLHDFPDYLPTYYTAGTFYANQYDTIKAAEILEQGIKLATENQNTKALRELKSALENL